MISVLAQERLLGAALGGGLTAVIIFDNRRNIYRTISENNAKFGNQPQEDTEKSVGDSHPKRDLNYKLSHLQGSQ
ncbi:uncharacterized protein LOC104903242 isoform X2 [Beta vulgaris subsp. vulgaris]|uniref:uncharacterized protein LOC104903242 isoform X2 n=1 Tax=Beta vulgaris subsp. vulgaris TaxID=3555 RepID=UPI002036B2EE|nr:uncharacterized protein LOC104903242 isoform X2 [Beta vulgaris subsp. vulgaris]